MSRSSAAFWMLPDPVIWVSADTTPAANASVAAARNHLSWRRDSPRAVRARVTRAAMAKASVAAHKPRMIIQTGISMAGSFSAAMANGLSTNDAWLIGPGMNATMTDIATTAVMASHPTGRQRGEGRCPSGKSSGLPMIAVATAGTQTQASSQARSRPNGRDPGEVRTARIT